MGNYRYDTESKHTLQFFEVQHNINDKPISVIELKIESSKCFFFFFIKYSINLNNFDKIYRWRKQRLHMLIQI